MHLIRYLSSSDNNRLTVIEKKQERCKEASANSDATILNADGSKPDVLKLAEASQADIVIVTTDDDRVNLAATRQAKREFGVRSEEHTSELQSQSNLVCRLLLEKKKKKQHISTNNYKQQ